MNDDLSPQLGKEDVSAHSDNTPSLSRSFVFAERRHTRGDENCSGCGSEAWRKRNRVPERHNCGGLVHHEYTDECARCDAMGSVEACDSCNYIYDDYDDHLEQYHSDEEPSE